jgi:DNA topoisomerase-1
MNPVSMQTLDGPEAAKAAGLRYTTDAMPGIRRVKRGKSFSYVGVDGKPIKDKDELARIRSLAVPPAYTDVWICPIRNGHVQATGRDARGRKQYRYHKRWRAVRDETKFDRMIEFAKALPAIRGAIARDLKLPGLPREKVIATVVSLLEETAIRVGNEEYARDNDSFGLTTLQDKHAKISGDTLRFHFKGKSGVVHDVTVKDKRIARIVKESRDLPGQHLFEWLDEDGNAHPIHSDDVNAYLREVTGEEFSAKDFRTWEATMYCSLELAAVRSQGKGHAKTALVETIKKVADRLRNTPAVCKKSYIHPAIIEEFLANGALALVERAAKRVDPHALSRHEAAVVAFLEKIVAREKRPLKELLERSVRAAKRKRAA